MLTLSVISGSFVLFYNFGNFSDELTLVLSFEKAPRRVHGDGGMGGARSWNEALAASGEYRGPGERRNLPETQSRTNFSCLCAPLSVGICLVAQE